MTGSPKGIDTSVLKQTKMLIEELSGSPSKFPAMPY
jgi:hypothetical protein